MVDLLVVDWVDETAVMMDASTVFEKVVNWVADLVADWVHEMAYSLANDTT